MLIPVYHVVAASLYPVATATTTIYKGNVISLTSAGEARLCDNGDTGALIERPIGLAGDQKVSLTSFNPRTSFVNRVASLGDDTYASNNVTVYHSGGEFYVDLESTTNTNGVVESNSGTDPGQDLYRSSATDGKLFSTATTNFADVIATIVDNTPNTDGQSTNTTKLETGIPNEFEPSGDSDTEYDFLRIILKI